MVLSPQDRELVALLQEGLPLVSRPYAELAARSGLDESRVRDRIGQWLADGTIRRLGVVVRHHELGFTSNGMVVWDLPDARVEEVGRRFAAFDCVSLCYRRPRRPPAWPYNLFCMIHGRTRAAVLARVGELARVAGVEGAPHRVLFSSRRFKQRGARYVFDPAPDQVAHGRH
jgi:DNA-binding Lrp family transcriptional regulator